MNKHSDSQKEIKNISIFHPLELENLENINKYSSHFTIVYFQQCLQRDLGDIFEKRISSIYYICHEANVELPCRQPIGRSRSDIRQELYMTQHGYYTKEITKQNIETEMLTTMCSSFLCGKEQNDYNNEIHFALVQWS